MANVELNPPNNCQNLVEADASCTDFFCSSSLHRDVIYRSCEQGQRNDANLTDSSERCKKTAGWRSRKSSDSQDFEFDMRLGFGSHSSQSTQAVLASADELFYQGQLLPLEPESGILPLISKPDQRESNVTVSCLDFTSRNQSTKWSSCRMDTIAFGTSLEDFRCSASFRSQSSGRWDSTALEKGTKESRSSRDSNESSQDSCFSGDKDLPGHRVQGGRSSSEDWRPAPADAGAGGLKRKTFFGGLKKIFTVMKELSSNEVLRFADSSSQGQSSSNSSRYAESLLENDATARVCEGMNSRKLEELSGMHSKTVSKVEAGSAFCRSKTKNGMEGEKHRSAWRTYARKLKPLYAKLLHGRRILLSGHRELRMDDREKARAMASSARSRWSGDDYDERLACSSSRFPASASCPASVRSSPTNSGVLAIITKSPSKPRPAIDSSPPSISISTMQELHSAIQGAIAHCKESISFTPIQALPSEAVP